MLHLAVPSLSVRAPGKPYTCPGLGDRIHTVMLGYNYGRAHGDKVTLHLTEDKVNRDKPESWKAIVDLFPAESVCLMPHPESAIANKAWVKHLRDRGYDAQCYYYGDTFGMYPCEEKFDLDISEYLDSPALAAPDCGADFHMGGRYCTIHLNGTGQRAISVAQRENIVAAEGPRIRFVTVGDKAEDPLLRSSLKHVGYAMYHANRHIGVDSGPMHLAYLYKEAPSLNIYAPKAQSHHVKRWVAKGAHLNLYA